MANCAGFFGNSTIHWSRRNGTIHIPPLTLPDGQFTINDHAGSTVFTGQHRDPQGRMTALFNTQCVDTGANTFRIRIHRLDMSSTPPEQFIYTGNGTVNPVTGDVTIIGDVHVPGHPDGGDTGTWQTSRPGGGGGGGDDKDKKKNKDDKKKDRQGTAGD